MNPAATALANVLVFAAQELLKYGPELFAAIQKALSKSDPTLIDWASLRLAINAKSYEDYVPETDLPKV